MSSMLSRTTRRVRRVPKRLLAPRAERLALGRKAELARARPQARVEVPPVELPQLVVVLVLALVVRGLPDLLAQVDRRVLVRVDQLVLVQVDPRVLLRVDPRALVRVDQPVLVRVDQLVLVQVDPRVLVRVDQLVLAQVDQRVRAQVDQRAPVPLDRRALQAPRVRRSTPLAARRLQ